MCSRILVSALLENLLVDFCNTRSNIDILVQYLTCNPWKSYSIVYKTV